MMGIYFAMTGIGNKLAGLLGESASNLGINCLYRHRHFLYHFRITCYGVQKKIRKN